MISVIIPLYNKASQIVSTLRSVLVQTYQDFEIIVVDDGSTDNSVAEVEKLVDARIRIVRQKNAGVSAARNKGIAEAKGEFIALLDGDDCWKETYLETQLQLTREFSDCDVYVTNYELRDEAGNTQSTVLRRLHIEDVEGVLDNYFEVATYSSPPICSISIMVRRGVFESVGGFPLGIRSGEDLLTWARLACRYKIAFSKKVCATYNLGEGYDFANTPPRRQDSGDPVGKELLNLWKVYHTPGLKRYIGHWHKMRASVAIRYFERRETVIEACKSLWYHPLNIKILPFFFMPFVPKCILRKLFLLH